MIGPEPLKITDNQVKAAAMTIADYCSQRSCENPCKGCAILPICRETVIEPPEHWPEYMEK